MTTLDQKGIRELLRDRNTYGTVLHIITYMLFGDELYELDSVELYKRISEVIGEFMPEENESKLQAIMTITTTDLFYKKPDVFSVIAQTLINGDPGITEAEVDTPSLSEVVWALYEAELNREEFPLSPSVVVFIDKIAESEGFDYEDTEQDSAYYMDIVVENVSEMADQLKKAGITGVKFPAID